MKNASLLIILFALNACSPFSVGLQVEHGTGHTIDVDTEESKK